MAASKLIPLIVMFSLVACSSVANAPVDTPVGHVVVVWMKDPGNLQHRQQLMEASRQLGKIEGVSLLSFGQPLPSDRDVVDDSFDVALYFEFSSKEALQAYSLNPLHLQILREQIGPLTDHYTVYDFEISP